ncbi:hypothetical protein [Streptococcus sp.]|uniref:hypothetical protein n=1 Tax=Streptococcus sp. TaxID=1306 RepID=UPI00345C4ED8
MVTKGFSQYRSCIIEIGCFFYVILKFLGDSLPSLLEFLGIAIVTIGIIGNSLLTGLD